MARSGLRRSIVLACCVVLPFGALLLAFATPASADMRYLYDELGRLVRVIREDGEAASYHYDAVGNMLRITRESGVAQTTTVTSQSAMSGSRQTSVTVTLTGSNLIGAGVFSSVAGISFQSVVGVADPNDPDDVVAGANFGLGGVFGLFKGGVAEFLGEATEESLTLPLGLSFTRIQTPSGNTGASGSASIGASFTKIRTFTSPLFDR